MIWVRVSQGLHLVLFVSAKGPMPTSVFSVEIT